VPADPQAFLDQAGPKTRNMVRKASRSGYTYGEFSWNDRLGEIHAINTSKARRSGGQMSGWYVKPVERRTLTPDQASRVRVIGGFKDGRLRAYAFLVLCGDFGHVQHCIGHAEDLPSGVMNGLVFAVVEDCIGRVRSIAFGRGSDFKRHNGFDVHAVVLDLGGHLRSRA
jgi:hypothetical protein